MAVTEKDAVWPAVMLWLAGWVVIVGGPCAGAKVAQTKVVPVIVTAQGPVPLPADWLTYVNAPQTEAELERIRRSVMRGCPYGGADWVQRAAAELGLQSTLRPRGRPRRPPMPAPVSDQAILF